MPRKVSEENERIKRAYLRHLRGSKGADEATIDKVADGLLRFEKSISYQSFKRFRLDWPIRFQEKLNEDSSATTGKPLSKATISHILRVNKAFFTSLAGEPGYKSRIRYADAEYFNQNTKDARTAHDQHEIRYPSLTQSRHAFDQMPEATDVERRNKALFAFLMITAARDGAIASLRHERIDLAEGCVYRDARDVRTEGAKAFTTYFLPIDPIYRACFENWVHYLTDEKLFGHDDALFPLPEMGLVNG